LLIYIEGIGHGVVEKLIEWVECASGVVCLLVKWNMAGAWLLRTAVVAEFVD